MSELASFVVDRLDDIAVGVVSGEIDLSNATELENAISDAIPNSVRGMILDLSGLTYLDSAGVRLVLSLAGRLRWRGQELVLTLPPDSRCRRVLSMAGVGGTVALESTVADARFVFRGSPSAT